MTRSRDDCPDLLVRHPQSGTSFESRADIVVDRAAQLRELAALVGEGLLTSEELERQRREVLGA